ncbi:Oxysterol-binding protein-related protein 8 [Operophtera brumata]|uniref:Oxysterol-binding protein-related protein 8 n=1 Tax=Operophtera brumata TaxID=104452 RepID=A0A0L7LCM0_OPEBR|nr:Oxysterol-binding protein-related protein 8 [Operophtera brumata]
MSSSPALEPSSPSTTPSSPALRAESAQFVTSSPNYIGRSSETAVGNISRPQNTALSRKESYKAQRQHYSREKKRAATALLHSIEDPAVVVLHDWLKSLGRHGAADVVPSDRAAVEEGRVLFQDLPSPGAEHMGTQGAAQRVHRYVITEQSLGRHGAADVVPSDRAAVEEGRVLFQDLPSPGAEHMGTQGAAQRVHRYVITEQSLGRHGAADVVPSDRAAVEVGRVLFQDLPSPGAEHMGTQGPHNESIGAVVQPLPTAHLIFRAPSQAAGHCWLDGLELALTCSNAMLR